MKRSGQSLKKFTVTILALAFVANCGFAFYGNDLTFTKTLLGTNVWKGDWQVKTIDEQKALEIEKIVDAQTKEHQLVTRYAGVVPAVFEKYVTAVADTVGESGQKIKAVLVPGSILVFNDSGKFEAYFLAVPNLRISGSWRVLDGNLQLQLDKDYCDPFRAGYEFNYKIEKVLGAQLKLSGAPVEDLKKIAMASAQAQMEGKDVLGYVVPRAEATSGAKPKAEADDVDGEKADAGKVDDEETDADEEKPAAQKADAGKADEDLADEEAADDTGKATAKKADAKEADEDMADEETADDAGKATTKKADAKKADEDMADEEDSADDAGKADVKKADAPVKADVKKDAGAVKADVKKDAAVKADAKKADVESGDDDDDASADDTAKAPAKKADGAKGAKADKGDDDEATSGW